MICRSCLRARALAQASRLSSISSRQPTTPLRSLSSTATRSLPKNKPESIVLFCAFQNQSRQYRPQIVSLSQRHFSSSTEAATSGGSTTPVGPEKPDYMSEGESRVWDILIAEFSPTELMVKDISGGCGSMYGIDIVSEKFRGLNMLKQQRLVNAALGDLVKEWHGLQLKTKTP